MSRAVGEIPGDLPWVAAFPDAEPEYREAEDFKSNIEPLDDVDYGWVCDYAEKSYERSFAINSIVDAKANDVIRSLGGGTLAFTLVAITQIRPGNAAVFAAAIPSFFLAVAAISFAFLVRRTHPTAIPTSIRGAYRYADAYRAKARATFIGQWHLADVGMLVVVRSKKRKLNLALGLSFAAIAALSLPFLTALYLALR